MLKSLLRFSAKKAPESKLLKTKSSITKKDIAIIAGGLLIFAAAALYKIGASSIWFDEAFSAYLIRFSFVDIFQYTSADVHPPLYYILLKLWSYLFGTTDVALRSLGVLFSGVAVTFVYLTIHRLFGRKAAIFSLGALVISPFLVRYTQEMRMYSLIAAITMAATYVLIRATESGSRKYWLTYGVLVSLGMWTHYFAALVWLAHWVWRWTLIRRIAPRKGYKKQLTLFFSKDWVFAHIVAVGLFIVWLPFLIKQLLVVQAYGFWIPPVSPVTISNYFTNAIFYLDQNGLTPWHTLGFIALIAVLIWSAIKIRKNFSPTEQSGYSLLVAVVFVPITLLLVSSMPPLQSTFIDRYLVPSSVALSTLIGVTLALLTSKANVSWVKQAILTVFVGAFLLIGLTNVYSFGNFNKTTQNASGAKQIMTKIYDHSKPGEVVMASDPWVYYDAVFYANDDHQVVFRDLEKYEYGSLEMLRSQDLNKIKNTDKFINAQDTFWFVGRPGEASLTKPAQNLKEIESLRQNDPITHKPAYQAVHYKVIHQR